MCETLVCHILCACIEAYASCPMVVGHDETGEIGERFKQPRLGAAIVNVTIEAHARADWLKSEANAASRRGVAEEILGLRRHGACRLGHKVNGEALAVEHTCHCAGGAAGGCTVEIDRGRGGDAAAVGDAQQLEVVVLVKVVARNGLVEAQLQVVAHTQNAVGGLRVAEDTRTAGVLDARLDGRGLADESAAMTAETHGAQVVVLLHGIAFAVEPYVLDAAALDHLLVAAGGSVEGTVSIVGAKVHPTVIALGRELVLQFYVVETTVVHVKVADGDGQVVAHRVLWSKGVHYPVVLRRGKGDVTRYR